MNKRPSLATRFFALFLAAQFLNVQIQSSFATEAITESSPEVLNLIAELRNKITLKSEGKSSTAMMKIAYKLYKLDIKLHNKAVLTNIDQKNDLPISAEDLEPIKEYSSENYNIENQQIQNPEVNESHKQKVLANSTKTLIALGSTQNSNGELSKVTYQEFKKNIEENIVELRGPASAGKVILQVILSLLIVAAGLTFFYFSAAIIGLMIWGNPAIPGALIISLLAAGLLTGMFFAVRAVWTSHPMISAQNSQLCSL